MSMNRSIVDNWLLELASDLINRQCEHEYSDFANKTLIRKSISLYTLFNQTYSQLSKSLKKGYFKISTSDHLMALFQLIDLIVTSDKLLYDPKNSQFWQLSGALKAISSLLSPISIDKEQEKILGRYAQLRVQKDTPDIVQEGAFYYLTLSRILGAYYWPSPRRAEFLAKNAYSKIGTTFVVYLKEFLDDSISRIVNEVLGQMNVKRNHLIFLSFSSSVLSNCDSCKSILKTAMEFRETKECKGFRKWLQEMDTALVKGNITIIAKAIRELNEVLDSVRSGLKLTAGKERRIEFQIGLSPSIKLNSELLPSVLKWFKLKPYHIVFLRNHYSRVLANSDAFFQIKRLFFEFCESEVMFSRVNKK